jgi:PPE-repeat protein
MLTAASAWDELANELHSSADDVESVVAGLTSDAWQGPASASMGASAAPQTEWLRTTATQATQASAQAKAAASAYESAYSMTVPPSQVAANRAELMTLASAAPKPAPAARAPGAPEGATAVSAEMGESGSLGRLSVPQGWASSAPQVRLAAIEAPMASAAPASASATFGDMPLLGQAPLMAMPGRDTARGPQTPGRQRVGVPGVVAAPESKPDDRAAGAAAQMREITEVLGKLADLRDNGALTAQEFNEQKQRLLGGR